MADPAGSVQSPNANKTVGGISGGLSGGGVGVLFIIYLNYRGVTLGDAWAGIVASAVTAAAAAVGTFFAPLLTAAQHRAVQALSGSGNTQAAQVIAVARAQDLVDAAGTFTKKP